MVIIIREVGNKNSAKDSKSGGRRRGTVEPVEGGELGVDRRQGVGSLNGAGVVGRERADGNRATIYFEFHIISGNKVGEVGNKLNVGGAYVDGRMALLVVRSKCRSIIGKAEANDALEVAEDGKVLPSLTL